MKTHECPDTKICTKCETAKPLVEFYFYKKRGYYEARCKACAIAQAKQRAERKTESIAAYQKRYRAQRKGALARQKREWYERTRDKQIEARKRNYEANRAEYIWRARKRDRHILQATPIWCDTDAVAAIYEEAAELTRVTGVAHHVDHIVPLFGLNVRGLHVPANLRAIPALENRRKYNKMVEDIV